MSTIDATLSTASKNDTSAFNATDRVKVAQSFKALSSNNLVSCKLYMSKSGSPTGTITVDLYTATDKLPSGSSLATSNSIDVSTLSIDWTMVEFTFSSPYTMTEGDTYALVVSRTYVDGGNNMSLGINYGGSAYTDGAYCAYGTSWGFTYDATTSWCFETYVEAGAPPPTPSTIYIKHPRRNRLQTAGVSLGSY